MYEIPTQVYIEEQSYAIRNQGDYRMVLDCFSALNDNELSKEERLFSSLIIFYEAFEDLNSIIVLPQESLECFIQEMYRFFNGGQDTSVGAELRYNLLDWDKDSQLVCSGINKVAGKEIRSEAYLHWWTFLSYYMAIGEGPLSTVLSIRHKIVENKKLEKYEKEFRRNNPQYFVWDAKTVEQKEADDWVRSVWNKGVKQ